MKMKSFSLQETKLYCPKPVANLIPRKRLEQILGESLKVPLTLISAPPGYGKSVLASSWVRAKKMPVAWLTLDDEESNFHQFLVYLLASLESVKAGAFKSTATVLATPRQQSINRIAQLLAKDISALDEELVVILDDYHHIDHSSVVHELLGLILNHPPSNLHIVILTRRDPPFALARLRANGQVVDVRLADLRFRASETKELLHSAIDSKISASAVDNVQKKLEGWGAGIRMVSLVACKAEGREEFLLSLTGEIQQIHEYLFEEVIQGLDQSTQIYMLCSALLQRFSAELLDVMVASLSSSQDEYDGKRYIEFVEHCNMFTISMDSVGTWHRYHNIFRELLLERVRTQFGKDDLLKVIIVAADWLKEHDYVDDAIRLLLEQKMNIRAAELVERHRMAALDEDNWLKLEGWLQKFSSEGIESLPTLLLARASIAVFSMDIELVGDLVHQLDANRGNILTPGQEYELNFLRALPMFWSGAIKEARQALEQEQAAKVPTKFDQRSGELHMYLAVSRAMTGEFDLALQGLEHAAEQNKRRRNIFATRLFAAKSYIYYFSLQAAETLHNAEILAKIGASEVHSKHAIGWGHYMRTLTLLNTGRFEMAFQASGEALLCGDHLEKHALVDLYLAKGICAGYLGNADAVADTIDKLKTLIDDTAVETGVAELALSAVTRITLRSGNRELAIKYSAELPRNPSTGTLVFWLDEPSLTWARVQLAGENWASAQLVLPLLVRLREQANSQHLVCCQVELLLLEAIARSQLGQGTDAVSLFNRAVDLAAPAGWIGPFAELAPYCADLIPGVTSKNSSGAFIEQVLAMSSLAKKEHDRSPVSVKTGLTSPVARESFTNRELDILELLSERYRNKEIADKLFISTNTVNYHLKHIYQKLDASSRREAVSRAIELGLLVI